MGKIFTVKVVIIPIVLGLLAFGMKVPDLSGISSAKPKPRPRAIVHKLIQSCKACEKKQGEKVPVCYVADMSHLHLPSPRIAEVGAPATSSATAPFHPHSPVSSRAPPIQA